MSADRDMLDLDALEAQAKRVTPPPGPPDSPHTYAGRCFLCRTRNECVQRAPAHVLAGYVLGLVAEVRRLSEERAEWYELWSASSDDVERLRAELEAKDAAILGAPHAADCNEGHTFHERLCPWGEEDSECTCEPKPGDCDCWKAGVTG